MPTHGVTIPFSTVTEIVGMTSSGGYGHRTDKSIALGYVPLSLAAPGTRLEVEVLGQEAGRRSGGHAAVRSEKRADESVKAQFVNFEC
jgi:glycine cleavage system aminomethyltransferase T